MNPNIQLVFLFVTGFISAVKVSLSYSELKVSLGYRILYQKTNKQGQQLNKGLFTRLPIS